MDYKKMKKSDLIKELEAKENNCYTIKNCIFKGVEWDRQAIEGVNNVSKALLNLTELFKAQNINIEPMIKIESQ